MAWRRVTAPGGKPYDVVIGWGAQAERGLVLAGTARAAFVHAPPLAALAGAAVETLQTAGVAAEAVVVPDGEAAKTVEVAAGAWEEFGRLGLTRSDAVVGIGGGGGPRPPRGLPPPPRRGGRGGRGATPPPGPCGG